MTEKRLSLLCPILTICFLTASTWFNWTVRWSSQRVNTLLQYPPLISSSVSTHRRNCFFCCSSLPLLVSLVIVGRLSFPPLSHSFIFRYTTHTQKMRKWKGRAPEMKCLGRGRRWNSGWVGLTCMEEKMLRSIDFFLRHPCPMDYWNGIKKKISSHQTVSFGEGSWEWQLLRRLAIVVISQFDFYSIQSCYYKPLSICFPFDIEWGGVNSRSRSAWSNSLARRVAQGAKVNCVRYRLVDAMSWCFFLIYYPFFCYVPPSPVGDIWASVKKWEENEGRSEQRGWVRNRCVHTPTLGTGRVVLAKVSFRWCRRRTSVTRFSLRLQRDEWKVSVHC